MHAREKVSGSLNCSAFSCELQTPCIITLWYNMCTTRVSPLYSCMQCLKHYDLLFKYMNPLSYQIMIFVSLLHPHNPLTFVATTNFLSCMHTPSCVVVLHMLYHNVIMHGVCNSQLNVEQSKPYYTSNNLTFYLNL